MDVGEVDDAKTLEGLWQALQLNRPVLDGEHERLGKG